MTKKVSSANNRKLAVNKNPPRVIFPLPPLSLLVSFTLDHDAWFTIYGPGHVMRFFNHAVAQVVYWTAVRSFGSIRPCTLFFTKKSSGSKAFKGYHQWTSISRCPLGAQVRSGQSWLAFKQQPVVYIYFTRLEIYEAVGIKKKTLTQSRQIISALCYAYIYLIDNLFFF